MKKLQLNKLKPQDLEVLNETLELYGAYLFFFIQSEPSQALYIYKSICVELQFMIANKLKVRSLPANTLLNLEQHQAFVFSNQNNLALPFLVQVLLSPLFLIPVVGLHP